MNYPSDLELEVDTLLPDINYVPEVENVAEIFAYASGNNPTALQAEYQLTQSKYQYRIYKGKLLPSIYLNAGISTSYFENLKSDNAPEGFKDQFKKRSSLPYQYADRTGDKDRGLSPVADSGRAIGLGS